MLALEPTVVDAIWQSFAAYLPKRVETDHPLGCHRPRISDRDCFEAILFRLVTGCSWDVAGRLGKGSETTLRRRRDEWVQAGAFQHLVEEAIKAFDKVIGLDLSEVSVDGSLHKAPMGGEGTGPSTRPTGVSTAIAFSPQAVIGIPHGRTPKIPQGRPRNVPTDGHGFSPRTATRTPRGRLAANRRRAPPPCRRGRRPGAPIRLLSPSHGRGA